MEGRKVNRNSLYSVLNLGRNATECDFWMKHVHLRVAGHQNSVHTGRGSGYSRVCRRRFSCFVQHSLAERYVNEELKVIIFDTFSEVVEETRVGL